MYLASGCASLRVLALSHCAITDMGLRALARTLSQSAATSIITQAVGHRHQQQNGGGGHQAPGGMMHAESAAAADGDVRSPPRSSPDPAPSPVLLLLGCTELTTLEIARCSAVTDSGLTDIARACKKVMVALLMSDVCVCRSV